MQKDDQNQRVESFVHTHLNDLKWRKLSSLQRNALLRQELRSNKWKGGDLISLMKIHRWIKVEPERKSDNPDP